MMSSNINMPLFMGSIASFTAAIAHLGCIVFGAPWYRFFGAGEQMAKMAEAGDSHPTIVTSMLVLILFTWGLYGLSGTRLILKLPLLKTALITISSIYILRGVLFVFLMPTFPENSLTFWLISSFICLLIGLLYAWGTYKSGTELS